MGFADSWTFRDCSWCGLHDAQFLVKSQFGADRPNSTPRFWTVVVCPRCGAPTLIEHTAPNRADWLEGTYPAASDLKNHVSHLPDDVQQYLDDADRCMRADIPDAAAVSLRRTLEAAAAHASGPSRDPLVRRIQKLIGDGLVAKAFGPALGYVRKVGNQAAHAGDERVTSEEAEQAYRFTVLLLRNLFELPGQVGDLEAERPPPPVDDDAAAV